MKTFRLYLKNNLITDFQAESKQDLMENLDGDWLEMISQGLVSYVKDLDTNTVYHFMVDYTKSSVLN